MRGMIAIIQRNLTNFTRDKIRLFASIFMSGFFLFIFSFVMKSSTTGIEQPLNYLISGIIIMTVFQSALSNSTNIIEDISMGFMKEIIVSPVARWQISIGQVLSSAIIAVLQGVLVIIFALFMGLKIDVLQFLEMTGVMIAVGVTFGSIGLYLASIAKNSAAFQVIITLFTMPLTFLSGAYIPTTVMPKLLRPLVYLNPLTYTTSIFRYISLKMDNFSTDALIKSGVAFDVNGFIIRPYFGLFIILGMGLIFFILCVIQFNKADFSKVKVFNPHQ
ncbi:ABC transporter permease [Clostridium folliculivorans]|uniref:Transport permease protein n=1 Tax=Clostridium folliculivorans TaxID=2886038 RepID=A0A9W5Y0S5_9CLOT|nr:ABC transporter permease [Clostridium folliculivorans]GKU24639.1 ABC transporter [Clostridium folliculivorans]GKU30737.1 ABC transporter [Clostridium folliculivorans]